MMELRPHYLERQLGARGPRADAEGRTPVATTSRGRSTMPSRRFFPESHLQEILDRLEKRFPGSGPLVERYETFRRGFVIPRDKLDPVFQKAIEGCRERTLRHVTLPADEKFTVEYVDE